MGCDTTDGGALDSVAGVNDRGTEQQPPTPVLESLPGHYKVWQEVLSHAVDDILIESTLPRLSCDELIDAYYLARDYQITPLIGRYGAVLLKRLAADTLVLTMEASLGLGRDFFMAAALPPAPRRLPSSSASASGAGTGAGVGEATGAEAGAGAVAGGGGGGAREVHLELLLGCLSFVERNAQAVFSKRSPQRCTEVAALITQALRFVLIPAPAYAHAQAQAPPV